MCAQALTLVLKRARIAVPACALLLCAPAGCGESDEPLTLQGSGYSYEVPHDWQDMDKIGYEPVEAMGGEPDSGAAGPSREGKRPTLTVQVVPPRIGDTPERTLRALTSGLKGAKSPVEPWPDVDGEKAARLDIDWERDGEPPLKVTQVAVRHAGRSYVLSFEVLSSAAEEEAATLKSITGSWRWK